MMKEQKTILQTFDYELFSKVPGTAERCMLEPTRELISCFDRHGMRTTFFVDILHYVRASESSQTKDEAKKIRDQLAELVQKGHRIELHLHPQWLNAGYENGQWHFGGAREFSIHNLDDTGISNLFRTGIQALEEIASQVEKGYKVLAYRGGGWCLQPFSRLRDFFIQHDLKVDSTVARGFYRTGSNIQYYDFRKAPDLEVYRFEDDPLVPRAKGTFLEIPITVYRLNIIKKIARRAAKKQLRRSGTDSAIYGDGKPLGYEDAYPGRGKLRKKIQAFQSAARPYSMYTLQDAVSEFLPGILERDTRNIVNFISHPKNLSPISLQLLDKLGQKNYKFLNIMDIYRFAEFAS